MMEEIIVKAGQTIQSWSPMVINLVGFAIVAVPTAILAICDNKKNNLKEGL